jgi:tetratricopeptide (TPR) repeat protein
MKLFFILLIGVFSLPLHALKLEEKIRYGDSLSKVKPQAAYSYFNNLMENTNGNESKEDRANLLSRMGQLSLVMGNYPQAIDELEKATISFRETGNEQALAYQLSQLGSAFYFSEFLDPEHALNFFENAYKLFDSLGLKNTATLNLNYSAYIYWAEGEKEKALNIHQRSLQIFDSLNYLRGKAIATSDIGFTLNSLNRYEEALSFNKSALKLANELNNKLIKIPILNNIGISLLGLEQLDSALYYSQMSLIMAEDKKLKPRISEALNALHKIQAEKGNFRIAYPTT